MRRHKDETMAEFDARIAAKNSALNMGWLDKGKQRKSASAELVDKIAKDVRKARKARKEVTGLDLLRQAKKDREAADERSFNAAEKQYARECREDDRKKKKRKDDDRWDMKGIFQADANGSLSSAVRIAQGTGLDLNALRVANVTRSVSKKGFDHPLDAWSVAEWTNAMQAEAGEAGNVAKKLIRIKYNTRGNKRGDGNRAKLLKALAQEVADAVVYADLCLASEGISLSDAVRDTFNRKSKEIGYKFKL